MSYNVSFTIHMDGEEDYLQGAEEEIKNFIYDNLDSSGVSVENINVVREEE